MRHEVPAIAVLIPAYNEADIIAQTIEGIKRLPYPIRIIVIDDGSSDNTGKEAAAAGAKVIRFKHNRGKGAALREGYTYIDGEDVIVFLDADIGPTSEQIALLIEPLLADQADVTIAKFVSGGEISKYGGIGMVKLLARWGIRILTGRRLDSVLSGQRAFKKTVLEHIGVPYNGYGIEFGMSVDILRLNYRIMEVDVAMAHRYTGKDIKGFAHRFHQFTDILKTIIFLFFKRNRIAVQWERIN